MCWGLSKLYELKLRLDNGCWAVGTYMFTTASKCLIQKACTATSNNPNHHPRAHNDLVSSRFTEHIWVVKSFLMTLSCQSRRGEASHEGRKRRVLFFVSFARAAPKWKTVTRGRPHKTSTRREIVFRICPILWPHSAPLKDLWRLGS